MASQQVLDEARLRKDLLRLRATLERKVGTLAATAAGPAPRALRSVGEVWMTFAKLRAPVRLGVLRASGHVQGPTKVGNTWQVRLVFGGPSAPYAAAVHEHLSRHSPPSWRNTTVRFNPSGTGPKYLESVVVERRHTFSREVAAFMLGGAKVYGAMFRR